jgi:hypothetical protein
VCLSSYFATALPTKIKGKKSADTFLFFLHISQITILFAGHGVSHKRDGNHYLNLDMKKIILLIYRFMQV